MSFPCLETISDFQLDLKSKLPMKTFKDLVPVPSPASPPNIPPDH